MFGWNLTHRPIGGFMGLPGNNQSTCRLTTCSDFSTNQLYLGGKVNTLMPSVDVYHREEDKLVENWVTLDFVHWLKDQGLDVFKRTEEVLNPKWMNNSKAS